MITGKAFANPDFPWTAYKAVHFYIIPTGREEKPESDTLRKEEK